MSMPSYTEATRVRRRWHVYTGVAVLVAVLVASIVLRDRLASARDDTRMWQHRAAQAQAHLKDATGRLVHVEAELENLRKRIQASVGRLERPTFVLWNVPITVAGNSWAAETVPDTFDLTVDIRASPPVYAFFLTVQQFACWSTNSCPLDPTTRRTGRVQYGARIKVENFNLAEGCGGWVLVIYNERDQPSRLTGTISATRNPADQPTTGCL
jgi:hypothetical protein